jgi:ABC-type nitrate/sulfonate/bicarbonate transport system ATPase subunit
MSGGIAFSNVSKSFRVARTGQVRRILEGFSLSVGIGELVALVGPSGIGKTTLLHLAAGLDQPDSGTVKIDLPAERSRVGMVFQQPRLLEWRSVETNVALATEAAGVSREFGLRMLAQVHMAGHEQSYPLSLSGGERQRVALARAFAIQPGIVLMDEPFSALDELTGRRLRQQVQELWRDQNPTGLLITHNTLEAAFLADRVVVLGGRPCSIRRVIEIPVARPREPDDLRLFEYHRQIVDALLSDSAEGS